MNVTSSSCPQDRKIPLYDRLPPSERAKYPEEFGYVFAKADELCAACPNDDAACSSALVDEYMDRSSHALARRSLEPGFRLNTGLMAAGAAGLRALDPGLGAIGLLIGAPLAIGGCFELYEGVKNRDQAVIVDAGFNLAMGALLLSSAWTPLGVTLAAPVLAVAREGYFALAGTGTPVE
ncbi:MAG: hypothetical protein HY319_26295 [Armatimonadetes bacterium]|nr:hypothetical protein [Armatimonadota bacterium]